MNTIEPIISHEEMTMLLALSDVVERKSPITASNLKTILDKYELLQANTLQTANVALAQGEVKEALAHIEALTELQQKMHKELALL